MSSVVLRDASLDDVDWVMAACQDDEIQRWTQVPRPYTREHALDFVSGTIDEFARWVIESVDDGHPVGVISIHGIKDGTASIGYWIAPQARGWGFTTAAIRLVCDEIERLKNESSIKVDMVMALIARDNFASRHVVEKAGFDVVNEQLGPAVENLVLVPTCVYAKKL
jgi:RimJ/RimL family protein N-acetyltransferase